MQGASTTPHSSSLAQVVCDWQPSKLSILAKHFADSSPSPEVSFSSYDSYRAYFVPLLLAEVAAELLSASEKFQRANPGRQSKVRARREEPGTTLARVAVHKVSRHHTAGFGWSVEVDSHDRKGPVGAVDSDVVACWATTVPQTHPRHPLSSKNASHSSHRNIPDSAVLAVVGRTSKRSGCRLTLSKFPDGNEKGVRMDLEEGEENEDEPPALRVWNVLRLGSLTTMKREFEALRQIKTSVLMSKLLRPGLQNSSNTVRSLYDSSVGADTGTGADGQTPQTGDAAMHKFRNEQWFSQVISSKKGLNPSQSRAVLHASTCRNGFSIIQGPPGTGKTLTLVSLLNVIHMTEYQQYYESLLASLEPLHSKEAEGKDSKKEMESTDALCSQSMKRSESSLLQTMMLQMNKTMSTTTEEKAKAVQLSARAQRPRLLICAPSNSAVDEILTRLIRWKFVDGQGRHYCPELARIGAGDRVSDAAKPFTAEGQAETFLDRVCGEDMTPDARKKAQMSYLSTWQNRVNSLLTQLARTPKKETSSHPVIIDLHEKLERMDRDLRRLKIAASDGHKALTREEKLRLIARTYVEDAQLVFATLSGSASSILTKKSSDDISGHEGALFDTVLIDEGAQATETSSLIPLTLGASQCILVGDPQQLPATVLSSGSAGLAYGQSLLERLCEGGQVAQLLDTQYRMHPAISSFPRRHFYNGRLVDDESVQGEHRAKPYHRDVVRPKLGPYVFLDISEGEESRSKDDRSIFNRAEAELASLIYAKLKKEYATDPIFSPAAKVQGSSIGFGVVTPYKRQMQELRQSFDRAGIPTGDVEIDTVDSFQGREKDVIVFSCVRTALVNRGIGFVRDVRRMNVGLTRARSSLIILGSAQALSEGSPDWAELIEDAVSRGCLINVSSVQKCLYPAIPSSNTSAVTEESVVDVHTDMIPESEVRKNLAVAPAAVHAMTTIRNLSGSHAADPRLRAGKRMPMSRVQESSYTQVHQTPSSNAASTHQLAAHVAKEANSARATGQALGSIQMEAVSMDMNAQPHVSMNRCVNDDNNEDHDVKNLALQSTLEQMSKILVDAGFQNTSGVEQTLREHLRGGGNLDLEAIMAAAIANNSANAGKLKEVADSLLRSSPASASRSAVVHDGINPDFEQTKVLIKQRQQLEEENGLTHSLQNMASSKQPQPKEQKAPSDKFKPHGNINDDVEIKANGSDKRVGKMGDKSRGTAPSGWEMLFASKKKSNDSINSLGKVKVEDMKSEQAVKNGIAESTLDWKDSDIKCEAPQLAINLEAKDGRKGPTSRKIDKAEKNISREQSEMGGSKGRMHWNENGREVDRSDRKKGRPNDYGSGANMRSSGRGERGRVRPKRGRGRGSVLDQNSRDRFQGHVQYDGNFLPFQGSGIETGMGTGPHSMNALPFIQQQAMQQQAMQQQAMQQQAIQQQAIQQAFQQQAFQNQAFQNQAYQQQAYQMQHLSSQQAFQHQEALRQQQAYMQMSGIAPGVGQNQYAMSEFDGGYSGGGGMMQGVAPRGGNWMSRGGSGGGRGNRGRGRGRTKYGGRGRRDV